MIFDEIEIGKKYALSHQVDFYNHRKGMFAYFDDGLVVEVYRKNGCYANHDGQISRSQNRSLPLPA